MRLALKKFFGLLILIYSFVIVCLVFSRFTIFDSNSIDQAFTKSISAPFCGYLVSYINEDRLGNFLFLYASFFGILNSQKSQRKTSFVWLQSDFDFFDNFFDNLSLPFKNLPTQWFEERNFTYVDEERDCGYDDKIIKKLACDGKNLIVDGYRQSFRYFRHVQDEIRQEFKFSNSLEEKCREKFNENFVKRNLSQTHCVTIGVHLRRGDFTKNENREYGHVPAKIDYLQNAISYFENRLLINNKDAAFINCLVFLILGDDHSWNVNASKEVQLLIPEQTHLIIVDQNNGTIDFCILTLCQHMAFSTGSFGWWAAFLGNHDLITYQKEYARPDSYLEDTTNRSDYFLPHWIPL